MNTLTFKYSMYLCADNLKMIILSTNFCLLFMCILGKTVYYRCYYCHCLINDQETFVNIEQIVIISLGFLQDMSDLHFHFWVFFCGEKGKGPYS